VRSILSSCLFSRFVPPRFRRTPRFSRPRVRRADRKHAVPLTSNAKPHPPARFIRLTSRSRNLFASLARRSLRSRHEARRGKCGAGMFHLARCRESGVYLPSGRETRGYVRVVRDTCPSCGSNDPVRFEAAPRGRPRSLFLPCPRLALDSVPCKYSQLHAPLPRHADIGRFFTLAAYRRGAAAARILSRTQSRSRGSTAYLGLLRTPNGEMYLDKGV